MDIIQLYKDFGVPYATEGHRHCREGWVNTPCPFCTGNPGYHLGYDTHGNYFVCWRCGWKATVKAISTLIRVSLPEAKEICRKYGGKSRSVSIEHVQMNKKPFMLPSRTMPMTDKHKRYLAKRQFDPDYVEKVWRVQGTGPVSRLDTISFSHRLVIPIHWENKLVSFQTRDITGKHFLRYISCPEQREILRHKHIFYQAIPSKEMSRTCICVEGVTDAWRFGTDAIATFGIKYTKYQVREISKRFDRVFVVFDDDPQAIVQADKLAAELIFRGVDAYNIKIKGDPGSMKQADADALKKELLG